MKKEKIVFVVYHDLLTEERSSEIAECLSKIGETTVVSYTNSNQYERQNVNLVSTRGYKRNYGDFIRLAIKTIKDVRPSIIMLHDNYTAPLIPYIRFFFPKTKLIFDSSELRLLGEKRKIKSFNSFVELATFVFEKFCLKKCDVTIAANVERASIMTDYYKLSKKPLIFDNVHKNAMCYDVSACEDKFSKYFDDGKFVALYAGGISKQRMTFELVKQLGALGDKIKFLVIGRATESDLREYNNLIKHNNITNTVYLGFVNRSDLKYLMEKSHVNIATFAMDTVNNINCASGKVYEGLFLGKPLLTGLNPPLKRLCVESHIGVSTDDFGNGIEEIMDNYVYYVENVKKYISQLDYENRVSRLAGEIVTGLDLEGC